MQILIEKNHVLQQSVIGARTHARTHTHTLTLAKAIQIDKQNNLIIIQDMSQGKSSEENTQMRR